MKLYSGTNKYKLYQGNMLDMLQVIAPNSVDSIVTDPPYELNFMGKGWDNSGIAFQKETWRNCYEVLKPGGYLLAFGGSRTFHRIACAIEDAGFEIRDTIMWIYGSGFPKSMNIGLAIDKKNGVESPVVGESNRGAGASPQKLDNHAKGDTGIGMFDGSGKTFEVKESQNEWKGWGTCLKPAFEPIIIARKPFNGSLVDNVLTYGVGGLNIGECRVPSNPGEYDIRHYTNEDCFQNSKPKESKFQVKPQPDGRFPANVILTYDETDYDEVCGGFPVTVGGGKVEVKGSYGYCFEDGKRDSKPMADGYSDSGSASRYFYCAKASKKDRDGGLDEFEERQIYSLDNKHRFNYKNTDINNLGDKILNIIRKNTHPTVKPCDLMQYLVRLVTPNGGTVLDPFNGSGSTGKATMYENVEKNKGYKYIGIELTEEYLPISKARIEYAMNSTTEQCDVVTEKVGEKCVETKVAVSDLW